MQDKTLTKISLIISLVGILILLLLLNVQKPQVLNIGDINELLINKNIQIQGSVINIKDYNNFRILTVQDQTGKISVILNENKNLNLELKSNSHITLNGKVAEYNQGLQIQADEIIL